MGLLTSKRCVPCEGGSPSLTPARVSQLLATVEGWEVNAKGDKIMRDFAFKNYYETMAFVNAIAWMAHQQNHHPDLEVSYNHCKVYYSTHSVHGLSDNDFICAAHVDALYRLP